MRTLLVGLLTCGCSLIVPEGDFGGDSDGDTDSESESDTGTGADSDTDSDTDTDTDSDTDTDADAGDPLDCAGGRLDTNTGLCWQHPVLVAVPLVDQQTAKDYCDDLYLAGHDDWYLPSRQDFIDLLGGCDASVMAGEGGYCNVCSVSPSCSLLFEEGFSVAWAYNYWTSTDDVNNPGSVAWAVRADTGTLFVFPLAGLFGRRCVREED